MASPNDDFAVDRSCSLIVSTSSLPQIMPRDSSPDFKCPICLDIFDNVSYLNPCFHRFCFVCIHEWSKNVAECPLCKQPIDSIIHTLRAEADFEVYLRPTSPDEESQSDASILTASSHEVDTGMPIPSMDLAPRSGDTSGPLSSRAQIYATMSVRLDVSESSEHESSGDRVRSHRQLNIEQSQSETGPSYLDTCTIT